MHYEIDTNRFIGKVKTDIITRYLIFKIGRYTNSDNPMVRDKSISRSAEICL